MPTPIEILLDPLSLTVLGLYGALVAWEALSPARSLPRIPGWKTRGLASFAVYFYVSSYLPLLWDDALGSYQLLDLSSLGLWGGAVAILLYEAGVYFWHRAMHASNTLWKLVHQMHHSAERVDTFGAYYFSPLDMVGWTFVGSAATVLVLGITPQAATLFLLVTTFLGLFQHANVSTPRWLGWIVQRPESHSLHHARGVHRSNYSDLPIFDWVFGTLDNPVTFAPESGFYDGASARIVDMLLFRDVSLPPTRPASAPGTPQVASAPAEPSV